MNDLIRPSLYGAHHAIEIVSASEGINLDEPCASEVNLGGRNSDQANGSGTDEKILGGGNLATASLCDVVGPICESGDFLAKGVSLPSLQSGDLLAIKSAGAYGFSMSSNYNTRCRAAEVAVYDGQDRLIRKRESFDELIALEKDFV